VRAVSVSGTRLDARQLITLCSQLSSLARLTSLRLSDNIVDVTPDDRQHDPDRVGLHAIRATLSALPSLRHLDLSDIC